MFNARQVDDRAIAQFAVDHDEDPEVSVVALRWSDDASWEPLFALMYGEVVELPPGYTVHDDAVAALEASYQEAH